MLFHRRSTTVSLETYPFIKSSDNFRIVFKWQECDNFIHVNLIKFGNLILCFPTKSNYYKIRNYIFWSRENRHLSILNNAKAEISLRFE